MKTFFIILLAVIFIIAALMLACVLYAVAAMLNYPNEHEDTVKKSDNGPE